MAKKTKAKPEFIDAQEMAKKHPATFEAPTKEDLDAIKPEHFVKVCHAQERFWNIVKKIKGNKITAEVNNDLIGDHPFKCGDTIEFEKRHVYSIMTGDR